MIDLEIWVSFFESSCTSIYSVSVEVTPRRFQDLLNSFGGLVVGDLLYMCLYSISRQSIYTYICIFKSIFIYIYTFTEYDIFPPPKESMLCVGVMHPTTMAPVQRRAPSRYQAGFSSDRSLF